MLTYHLEFQEILDGQSIPPGLHVQMDMTTGKKYAKILQAESDANEENAVKLNLNNNNAKQIVLSSGITEGDGNKHSDTVRVTKKVLKNESAQLKPKKNIKHNSKVGTVERNAFNDFVDDLPTLPKKELIEKLDKLEEILHEVDWSWEFIITKNGVNYILELLKHDDSVVRQKAALVLGSCLQNNYPVQLKLLNEFDLLKKILHCISLENDTKTLNRILFTLSSLLRSFPEGIKNLFMDLKFENGVEILLKVMADPNRSDLNLKRKFLIFFSDLFDREMVPTEFLIGEEEDEYLNKKQNNLDYFLGSFRLKDLEEVCLICSNNLKENNELNLDSYHLAEKILQFQNVKCGGLNLSIYEHLNIDD
ncbi:nucleotide exchange factor sil1 [Clydaea vesicula]|uniref:Nucleotide exchange factor SIL1 n=1 Tax=Clydaea vesicula TaxID=447962 RepID=A0AAD5U815_9FUNG|nr:nucleotide exchange factor sil1 [Clydaea vesicula]